MAGLRNPPFVAPVAIQELKEDLENILPLATDIDMWKEKYMHSLKHPETEPVPPPDAHFDEDPLALSVTSYLIWKNNPNRRWVPINEVGRPTPEARDLAHEIRKYYLQRGTMRALMGYEHTEFQFKMLGFLADTRPLKIDELGILYRIPYFYQEDLAVDLVFEGATDIENDAPTLYSITNHTILTPIREVLKSRKGGDYIQFWFSDTSDQRCVYDVKADNKLLSVFRSLVKQPELRVSCYSKMERLPGSHIKTKYWRLSNLELQ